MLKTYFFAIIRSFYDPKLYREVIEKWRGFGGAYLFLLSGVIGILLYIPFLLVVNTFETHKLNDILEQIPAMTIQDGEISVEGKQPHVISVPPFVMTIDTTKSESELRDTKTHVGIGKTFIFINMNGNYQIEYLKAENTKKPIVINKTVLKDMWHTNIPIIKTIALPLLWIGQFFNAIIIALVVAVVSYFVTAFMDDEYIFLTRMRLSAMAVTPPVFISLLLQVVLQHKPAPWFPVLLATLYLYVMIVLLRNGPLIVQLSQDNDV